MAHANDEQLPRQSGKHCGLPALSSDQMNWFFHHLRQQIPDLAGCGQTSVAGQLILTHTSSSVGSTLRLFLSKGRELHYEVAGTAAQVAVEDAWWAAAVTRAVGSFNADVPPSRSWAAVIGPSPDQGAAWERGVHLSSRLPAAVEVGPLLLSPMSEWITQIYPHPADRSRPCPVSFWPIEVRGTASAYYTPGAEDLAAKDLARLCLLLSLAWNQLWVHWCWPHVDAPEVLSRFVHDWEREMAHCWRPEPAPLVPAPQELLVPDWVPDAWSLLEQRPTKARALEACDSALRDVAQGRPSSAGIQFAAMLEQLSSGRETAKDRRKGALRLLAEFFAGGSAVTKNHEKLAEDVLMYGLRSETGHAGKRHGSEPRLGMPIRMTSIDGDPAHTYGLKIGVLSEVCRALLVHELGGPATDPEPIRERWLAITSGQLIIPGRV